MQLDRLASPGQRSRISGIVTMNLLACAAAVRTNRFLGNRVGVYMEAIFDGYDLVDLEARNLRGD